MENNTINKGKDKRQMRLRHFFPKYNSQHIKYESTKI